MIESSDEEKKKKSKISLLSLSRIPMVDEGGASAGASSSHSQTSLLSSLSLLLVGASLGALSVICYRRLATSQEDDGDQFRDDGEPAAIKDGVLGLVGGTPLVRVRCLSEATGCEVRSRFGALHSVERTSGERDKKKRERV